MTKHLRSLKAITLTLVFWCSAGFADTALKEWTFMTFLNGHNNLDSFGEMNVNQMKEVGSSKNVNIVVQWASQKFNNTKRIYVKKGAIEVVQELPRVDMGNYQEMVEFVAWVKQNYPAKHYALNIWNHGGGWHLVPVGGTKSLIQPQDISYDDNTGNRITTEQMGVAGREIQKILGQKLDILGTDACLMAMGEVGAEIMDSTDYLLASEEVIPGQGWPYNKFLDRWVKATAPTPAEVGTIITEEYLKSYSGGIYGNRSVTLSLVDLGKLPALIESWQVLTNDLMKMDNSALGEVKNLAEATQDYTYSDYKDIGDFLNKIGSSSKLPGLNTQSVVDAKAKLKDAIVSNQVSDAYRNSHGLSMWIPTSKWSWQDYQQRYKGLVFDQQTKWSDVLTRMFPAQ